jgi:long-chain acyl-CoA synthetase
MPITDYQNIFSMLQETVRRKPGEPALKWFVSDHEMTSMSWDVLEERVRRVAASLISLGVGKGDKVAVISNTRSEWVMADLGINALGACTVGIYQSNLSKECRYIIDHSDAVVAFAENDLQLEKLMEIRLEIPAVRRVVLFSGNPPAGDSWVISFEAFLDLGRGMPKETVDRYIADVKAEDPAGIIYTSGTTGIPKGVVLTHDNLTFTAQSVLGCGTFEEKDETFLFLPLAHVFARTCFYTAIAAGATVIFFRSMETLAEDLRAAKPHWFVSVPRIFEKIQGKILAAVEEKGGVTLRIFQWAHGVGNRVSDCILKKEKLPLLLKIQYAVASKLVFSKVKAAFGGRLQWCISGAAPLNPEIGKFFHACGILVLEGLGMTEDTSFSNVNRIDNFRFGWVGQPGPGIEQSVAEDGEILFRGRNVMREYYKMPEATAETITPDGWLKSGDIGEIDSENFLKITGRKKEIIITAGGKNIAPAPIESALLTSRYIQQAFVIGDKRKYLSALVTLDMDQVEGYARSHGIPYSNVESLARHERIRRLIDAEVEQKNREFASYEQIKKITIVPEFSIENGLLTPTLKLKKNIAVERFKNDIDSMYLKE